MEGSVSLRMLRADTITLLRFPFSLFLLPVFLFAWVTAPNVDLSTCWQVGLILHLLVYPASNGYNSWMDQDTASIGGLRKPPPATRELFWVTIGLDLIALVWSASLNFILFGGVMVYIGMSRLYSWRGVRLKQYPLIGFLTVFVMQGGWIYATVYKTISADTSSLPWLPMLTSSLLIGSFYPLTQVYQHQQDAADGVETLSMKLGVNGSFFFSAILFLLASCCMIAYWYGRQSALFGWLFPLCLLPAQVYFFYWFYRVWKNPAEANFQHSLRMNVIAGGASISYFIILLILQTLG